MTCPSSCQVDLQAAVKMAGSVTRGCKVAACRSGLVLEVSCKLAGRSRRCLTCSKPEEREGLHWSLADQAFCVVGLQEVRLHLTCPTTIAGTHVWLDQL